MAKRQKELEAQKKAQQKELERRRKLAAKGGSRPASRGERSSGGKGPLGLFSLKGLALFVGIGYLYVAQRELLLTLTLKPVLFVLRTVWVLAIKPVVRKLLSSKGGGGGELPGGY